MQLTVELRRHGLRRLAAAGQRPEPCSRCWRKPWRRLTRRAGGASPAPAAPTPGVHHGSVGASRYTQLLAFLPDKYPLCAQHAAAARRARAPGGVSGPCRASTRGFRCAAASAIRYLHSRSVAARQPAQPPEPHRARAPGRWTRSRMSRRGAFPRCWAPTTFAAFAGQRRGACQDHRSAHRPRGGLPRAGEGPLITLAVDGQRLPIQHGAHHRGHAGGYRHGTAFSGRFCPRAERRQPAGPGCHCARLRAGTHGRGI